MKPFTNRLSACRLTCLAEGRVLVVVCWYVPGVSLRVSAAFA